MNSVGKWCAILSLATTLVAQTSTPPKPKKARPATATAADVQALKDAVASQQAALAAQQQEIQALRDELHRKDQAVNQVQADGCRRSDQGGRGAGHGSAATADGHGTEERRDRSEDQRQQYRADVAGDTEECECPG